MNEIGYTLIFNILGCFIFLFLFWRKLKEDYINQQIFSTALFSLTGLLGMYFIALWLFPIWWFWISFLGLNLGIILGTLRFKLRFFETYEAAIVALFPWLALIFLSDSLNKSSWVSFIASLITLVFIYLFTFLNKRYKDFGWYKSGKIGFAGLTSLGIYFLLRGVIAIIISNVISFVGRYEAIISGIASFVLFLTVFNLSRQTE